MTHETDIGIGTQIHDVSDIEETDRAEELAVADCDWHKVANRSKYDDYLDVIVFRMEKGKRLKYRQTPLADMTIRNMERQRGYIPLTCDECGIEIEPDERAVWSGGKHYCMSCGRELYSEPVEDEGLMCTRCGDPIDISDDIWGFDEDSSYQDDICMCSRCAYITHRFPAWEQWLKET